MKCEKFIKECKAACCGIVPLYKSLFEKYKHLIKKPTKKIINNLGIVCVITFDNSCIFLDDDYKCMIYAERPALCKEFGNEKDVLLTCMYQNKNGKCRSDEEKIMLNEKITKVINEKIK